MTDMITLKHILKFTDDDIKRQMYDFSNAWELSQKYNIIQMDYFNVSRKQIAVADFCYYEDKNGDCFVLKNRTGNWNIYLKKNEFDIIYQDMMKQLYQNTNNTLSESYRSYKEAEQLYKNLIKIEIGV